jgi:predicted SnoaL-like aldol condensation-catalyzing enzyme
MSAASHPVTTLEQNKALIVRWFEEVWNQSRRESIFEMLPEGTVIHDGPRQYRGPKEFAVFYDTLQSQFSGIKITPIVSLAEGDLVCLHWSCVAHHKATGKSTEITGTSVIRVHEGRVAEGWQNWDAAHLFTQLTGQATLPV